MHSFFVVKNTQKPDFKIRLIDIDFLKKKSIM